MVEWGTDRSNMIGWAANKLNMIGWEMGRFNMIDWETNRFNMIGWAANKLNMIVWEWIGQTWLVEQRMSSIRLAKTRWMGLASNEWNSAKQ